VGCIEEPLLLDAPLDPELLLELAPLEPELLLPPDLLEPPLLVLPLVAEPPEDEEPPLSAPFDAGPPPPAVPPPPPVGPVVGCHDPVGRPPLSPHARLRAASGSVRRRSVARRCMVAHACN
jgi:hypothetical protein